MIQLYEITSQSTCLIFSDYGQICVWVEHHVFEDSLGRHGSLCYGSSCFVNIATPAVRNRASVTPVGRAVSAVVHYDRRVL